MKRTLIGLAALSILSAAGADEFDDLFSDDPFADVEVETSDTAPRPWHLSQEWQLQSIVNINSEGNTEVEQAYSGISSVEARWRPTLDWNISDGLSARADVTLASDTVFWLRPDEAWSDADIDHRQWQVEPHELTLQARRDQWQLSTGVQTVTLGLADALSVANILYGRDLSLPGTVDIDAVLMPAWTTQISGSLGRIRLRAGSVHGHQLNELPVQGTDFDTGVETLLDQAGLSLTAEPIAFNTMSAFASLSGVAGPLDWQLNTISQLSHSPVIEIGPSGPSAVHYPRENTLAGAASLVTGAILWKTETALTLGQQAQSSENGLPSDLVSLQRLSGTVGVDVDQPTLGRLVAELQLSRILDYEALSLLDTDESEAQWALMLSRSFLRETLTVSAQVLAFDVDASGGRLQSLGLEYDITDRWQINGRLIDYISGNSTLLDGADDRDRLLISARYHF